MSAVSPTLASMEPLSKVDSLIDSPQSPENQKAAHLPLKHRRRSSTAAPDVFSITDLEHDKTEITIPIETQRLYWKINTSPSTTIDDKDFLSLPLTNPKVKKIDLVFQAGLHVVARNPKGVTIKDAVDAIYKANKKKSADELEDKEYLRGFEWDPQESWTRLVVHLANEGVARQAAGAGGGGNDAGGGKKKKGKKEKAGSNKENE